MYRNSYKKGLLTILYSGGINPLKEWNIHRQNGYMKRFYERESGMIIMEMRGRNATVHYISCPKCPHKNLGIGMPIINLLIRNLNSSFSFEVQIKDVTNKSRRFRCANYLKCSSINYFETTIPLAICCDWVLIYFNLADFTRRCYCTDYFETERVQVNGNIHIRRIFFSDRVVEYSKLPKAYQLTTLKVDDSPGLDKPPRAQPPSPAYSCKELQGYSVCEPNSSFASLCVSAQCLDQAGGEDKNIEEESARSEKSNISVVTSIQDHEKEIRARSALYDDSNNSDERDKLTKPPTAFRSGAIDIGGDQKKFQLRRDQVSKNNIHGSNDSMRKPKSSAEKAGGDCKPSKPSIWPATPAKTRSPRKKWFDASKSIKFSASSTAVGMSKISIPRLTLEDYSELSARLLSERKGVEHKGKDYKCFF